MSKNTNIADLINYISVDGSGNVVLTTGGQVATQSYVTTAVSNLVNAAPSTLDTLNELAAALGNDANFATTVTTSIATKQAQLNGTGFVKVSGTTVSYDNSTYLTTSSASSSYVTLATLQTISGLKTFDATISANYGIALLNGAIPALTSIYYAALSGNSTGISITYRTGGGINYTNNLNFPDLNNSYLFPSTSGTLALTSSLSAYLPLTGGTLTGALSGTSATFGGLLTVNVPTDNTTVGIFHAGGGTANRGLKISTFVSVNDNAGVRLDAQTTAGGATLALATAGVDRLTIASTGAATFSGDLSITKSTAYATITTDATTGVNFIFKQGGVVKHEIFTNTTQFAIYNSTTGSVALGIANATGAATFSSSVTAASYIGEASTTELRLRGGGYGGSYNTSLRSIPGAIGVLQFGNNNDNYILVGNTAAGGYLSIRVNVSSESTTSGIEAMRITSGGNVGIGTTTPAGKLDISGGQYNTGLIVRTSSDNGAGLNLKCTDVGGHDWYVISTGTGNGGGAGNLGFYSGTNGNYLMYIKGSNGNVGIGTSSPTHKLSVNANAVGVLANISDGIAETLQISTGSGYVSFLNPNSGVISFRDSTNSTERMRITSSGDLKHTAYSVGQGIYWSYSGGATYGFYNNASGSLTLTNSGVANVGNFNMSSGAYTATSDINKKKDFEQSTIGLDAILGLKPTLYRMKLDEADSEKQLGFIAQEVKEFIPQAYVEQDDFIGLQDRPIIAALVKAVQELKAENDELREILNRNNII